MPNVSPIHGDGATRRQFLSAAALGLASRVLTRSSSALTGRRLSFENLHTGERLSVLYRNASGYDPVALLEIDHLLRDHRTGTTHPIDAKLLDLLHEVQHALHRPGRFLVVSGYRSPRTNRALREEGRNVALHSLHMLGKAVDVRLDGITTRSLRQAAIGLRRGGVGYYPSSDFVHLDVGSVRTW